MKRNNLQAIKSELSRNPNVLYVSSSQHIPTNTNSWTNADWPGKPKDLGIGFCENVVDYDFVDLYGIEIVDGRNFSKEFPTDARGAYLINESGAKALNWDTVTGREFSPGGNAVGKIVGIMKDFHLHSLHRQIEPLYLFLDPDNNKSFLSVKVKADNLSETMSFLRDKMRQFTPKYPFEYTFMDKEFEIAYKSEEKKGIQSSF